MQLHYCILEKKRNFIRSLSIVIDSELYLPTKKCNKLLSTVTQICYLLISGFTATTMM